MGYDSVDGNIDVRGVDNLLSLSRGLIPGTSHINKFGRNADIDIGPEDIWDGGDLWVPPTAARFHNIASSSGNDIGTVVSEGIVTAGSSTVLLIDETADFVTDGVAVRHVVLNDTNMDHSIVVSVDSATQLTIEPTHHLDGLNSGDSYRIAKGTSTGAFVIHVWALDEGMIEKEEFIVLNGTNNVVTIREYWRIYRMHADGAASRVVSNVGDITAIAQIDGTVTAQISVGNGQTLMAIYTIPAGKTGYMTRFSSTINRSNVGALANLTLRQTKFAALDGAGSIVEHYFSLATDGSSHITHMFFPYKVFRERTDIWIRCESVTAANTSITGAFDIILVNN